MNHYTYLIQNLEETMHYIGVRSCSCKISEDCYWGTSKYLPWGKKGSKKDQSHQAKKIILARFFTREDAIVHEIYLHALFNVTVNPNFWNKAKQTSKKFDTSGNKLIFTKAHIANIQLAHKTRTPSSYAKGWKHSPEAKKAIADAKRGIPRTDATKSILSAKMKKYYSAGNVNPMQGKTHSAETKKKISEIRKRLKHGTGTNGAKFTPWFIVHPDGLREEIYDLTKTEKSIQDGYKAHTYQDAYNISKGITKIKRGKFKNCIVGNIT